MTQTATKRNGRTATAVCRHSPNCEVVQTQKDLAAQIQAFSETLGQSIEEIDGTLKVLTDRVTAVLTSHHKLAESVTVLRQREEEWLRLLGEVERRVGRITEAEHA